MKLTFPPLTFVNVDAGKLRLCFFFCLSDDGGWLLLRLQLLDTLCQSSISLSSVDASHYNVFTAKKFKKYFLWSHGFSILTVFAEFTLPPF